MGGAAPSATMTLKPRPRAAIARPALLAAANDEHVRALPHLRPFKQFPEIELRYFPDLEIPHALSKMRL